MNLESLGLHPSKECLILFRQHRQIKPQVKIRSFWDEPCGTCSFLKGKFNTREDFDVWYLNFYPYLEDYIPLNPLRERRFWKLVWHWNRFSKLAESGALYHGMDIADGSVELVTDRLKEKDLSGQVVRGNILASPWQDDFFDWIISIGCLHHTGNFQQALSQVVRSLKPRRIAPHGIQCFFLQTMDFFSSFHASKML